jgi:hypothetical protein
MSPNPTHHTIDLGPRVDARLALYPRSTVERTMPFLLYSLAEEFGVEALGPEGQAKLRRALEGLGIGSTMTDLEAALRMRRLEARYGASVSRSLIDDIRAIYRESVMPVALPREAKATEGVAGRQ